MEKKNQVKLEWQIVRDLFVWYDEAMKGILAIGAVKPEAKRR